MFYLFEDETKEMQQRCKAMKTYKKFVLTHLLPFHIMYKEFVMDRLHYFYLVIEYSYGVFYDIFKITIRY